MDRTLRLCGLLFALIGGLFTVIGALLLPAMVRQAPVFLVFLVFPVLGLTFLGLGVWLLSWRLRRQRRCARLRQTGQRIWADLVDVQPDTRFAVNGRNPYVLICQAVDAQHSELCRFQSEGIWYDPTPWLRPGMKVPVYVDPRDWGDYVVDSEAVLPAYGR